MTYNDLTIATVNFMTPTYIDVLRRSLYKTNPWYLGDLYVYDNGTTKTLPQGRINGLSVQHISESLYDEFLKMPICNEPGCRNYASAKHAKTLQYIIDTADTNYLLILDSDVIFTDSFERLYTIFQRSNSVMCGFIRKPNGYADRIAPWCTFLNLNLIKRLGLRYYDQSRILYVNGNRRDDTGASILADCRKRQYPIIELPRDNMFYFHYKGGSYSNPNLVNQWIKKYSKFWE